MFDANHYVPVLRWKGGEQRALKELFPQDRERITPLIELPPRNTMPEKKSRRGLQELFAGLPEEIRRYWGGGTVFFDAASWSNDIRDTAAAGLFLQFFQEADTLSLNVIPVTGLGRGAAFQRAIGKVVSATRPELCIRLCRLDLEDSATDGGLSELLGKVGVGRERTHLVVDLQVIDSEEEDIDRLLANVPAVGGWATFTVVGGSFPKDLTGFRPGQHVQPRREWKAWKRMRDRSKRRMPTFGDYATLNPVLSPYVRGMNISASIRYTSEEYWVIMRGEGLRRDDGPGHAQYPANAELLTRRPEYCGPTFSFGDGYVAEIGLGKKKTGNPTTWLQASVNHHLTFVARQLAS